jgi:CRISPR/Cas system CMR-associated protein Cmr1 (group 7 of RAMP superfamily)
MPSHIEEYKYNEDIKTIKEIEFLIFGDRVATSNTKLDISL